MSKQEADAFVSLGRNWCASVWLGNDAQRGSVRESLKKEVTEGLSEHLISLNRGWQDYDPVIRVAGKAETYAQLASWGAGQPDGGKQAAAQFMDWAKGDLPFADLPQSLKSMAVITHVAEVGRGYSSALKTELYPLMEKIADSSTLEKAKKGWNQLPAEFSPALKYKQDVAKSFSPQ